MFPEFRGKAGIRGGSTGGFDGFCGVERLSGVENPEPEVPISAKSQSSSFGSPFVLVGIFGFGISVF